VVAVNLLYCIFSSRKVDMGDNPQQQFVWALKNGDMDQVKSIVGKVFVMPAQRYGWYEVCPCKLGQAQWRSQDLQVGGTVTQGDWGTEVPIGVQGRSRGSGGRRDLRERCKISQRGSGQSPGRKRI